MSKINLTLNEYEKQEFIKIIPFLLKQPSKTLYSMIREYEYAIARPDIRYAHRGMSEKGMRNHMRITTVGAIYVLGLRGNK